MPLPEVPGPLGGGLRARGHAGGGEGDQPQGTGVLAARALSGFPGTMTKVKLNFYSEVGTLQLPEVPSSCCPRSIL